MFPCTPPGALRASSSSRFRFSCSSVINPLYLAGTSSKHSSMPHCGRRLILAGLLLGRLVVLVWTPRGAARRIISMRHAHAEEETRWRQYLG
jgi:hypothetical protein